MDRSPLRRLAPFVALLVALVSPGLAQDGAAAPASVVPTEEAVDPLVAPWLGDRMVVPGERIGRLHLGFTTLEDVLGEDAPGPRAAFAAAGLTLTFDEGGTLTSVTAEAPGFATHAGVGVGTPLADAVALLGEPAVGDSAGDATGDATGDAAGNAAPSLLGDLAAWPGLSLAHDDGAAAPTVTALVVTPRPFDAALLVTRILRAGLGLAFFCVVAWLMSSHRRAFPWRVVVFGLVMQGALAGLILGTDLGRRFFQVLADFFAVFVSKAAGGAELVFGPLADPAKLSQAFPEELASEGAGFIFAFAGTGLLVIIFFSAVMSVLYHVGLMQLLVYVLAKVMSKLLGVSGAESMAMAANVFVGQTEAPLVVKPYIGGMTRSELNALMTGGFATIAGSVLAVYMGFLGPEIGPHLLTASVMSAPAAFLIAKIMLPETEVSATGGKVELRFEKSASNLVEAAANGTTDGLKLYLNVVAMLIAFVGLVALVDWPLEAIGSYVLTEEQGTLSLGRIFGWVFAPVAWAMGVEGWHDCTLFGSLLGIKIAVNEFVAMGDLTAIREAGAAGFHSTRSSIMAAYALCGFANFGSIGIQLGGISALAPERKADLAKLAVRAMLGGAFASWMTATVAGAFL